jgi:hypothetical protein
MCHDIQNCRKKRLAGSILGRKRVADLVERSFAPQKSCSHKAGILREPSCFQAGGLTYFFLFCTEICDIFNCGFDPVPTFDEIDDVMF